MTVLPPRAPRAFEWNLNTIVSIATLLVMVIGGAGALWTTSRWVGDRDNAIAELQVWRKEHEAEGKDRRTINDSAIARIATQVTELDKRIVTQDRDSDKRVSSVETTVARLSDRQAATDARAEEFQQSFREAMALLNQLNAQSTATQAILGRIEQQLREGRP